MSHAERVLSPDGRSLVGSPYPMRTDFDRDSNRDRRDDAMLVVASGEHACTLSGHNVGRPGAPDYRFSLDGAIDSR